MTFNSPVDNVVNVNAVARLVRVLEVNNNLAKGSVTFECIGNSCIHFEFHGDLFDNESMEIMDVLSCIPKEYTVRSVHVRSSSSIVVNLMDIAEEASIISPDFDKKEKLTESKKLIMLFNRLQEEYRKDSWFTKRTEEEILESILILLSDPVRREKHYLEYKIS